jgi:hypothetical protein
MGQPISIPVEDCVFLEDHPELLNEAYTVERTSGATDPGWRIPSNNPLDRSIQRPSASVHAEVAEFKKGGWRIFMDNGSNEPNEMLCGWRRLDSIWPTRLTDKDEIEKWRSDTLKILNLLEAKRYDLSMIMTLHKEE